MTLSGWVDPAGEDTPGTAQPGESPDPAVSDDGADAAALVDKPVLEWTNDDWASWIDSAEGGALPPPPGTAAAAAAGPVQDPDPGAGADSGADSDSDSDSEEGEPEPVVSEGIRPATSEVETEPDGGSVPVDDDPAAAPVETEAQVDDDPAAAPVETEAPVDDDPAAATVETEAQVDDDPAAAPGDGSEPAADKPAFDSSAARDQPASDSRAAADEPGTAEVQAIGAVEGEIRAGFEAVPVPEPAPAPVEDPWVPLEPALAGDLFDQRLPAEQAEDPRPEAVAVDRGPVGRADASPSDDPVAPEAVEDRWAAAEPAPPQAGGWDWSALENEPVHIEPPVLPDEVAAAAAAAGAPLDERAESIDEQADDEWAGVSDHPWWESAPVLDPEPVVFGDEPPTRVEAAVVAPTAPTERPPIPVAPERVPRRATRAMPATAPGAGAGTVIRRQPVPPEASHRVRSAFGLLGVAVTVGVVVAGLITVAIFAISLALRHAVG